MDKQGLLPTFFEAISHDPQDIPLIKSSRGTDFFVLSEQEFVSGVPRAADIDSLVKIARAYLHDCAAFQARGGHRIAVISDFEGAPKFPSYTS